MNEKELFEAIGEIDEKTLSDCDSGSSAVIKSVKLISAAAACVLLCFGAVKLIPNDRTAIETADTQLTEQAENKADITSATSVATDAAETVNTSEKISEDSNINEEDYASADSVTTEIAEAPVEGSVPVQKTEENILNDEPSAEIYDDSTDEEAVAVLAEAVYPEMPPYPNEDLDYEVFDIQYESWEEFRKEYHYHKNTEYKASMDSFARKSMNAFLTGENSGNVLYSPINAYFSLGIMAEMTDGSSRNQILSLMDAPDIETLRDFSNTMWKSNYSDDGAITSIFANSVWLDDSFTYNSDTLDILSDKYYASAFSGEMGGTEINTALRNWLNTQTGGLLKDEVSEIYLGPNNRIAQASTIFFRGKWDWKFNEELTEPDTFTAVDGKEITCDFMHSSHESIYYWGEGYAAVNLPFSAYNNVKMWFFLPDEGMTADELIKSGAITDLTSKEYFEISDKKRLIVNMAIPKFDASSSFDLREGLEDMGITDIFEGTKADFTPILGENSEGVSVSKSNHSVRVVIDEEGCTATAFTVISADGAAAPPDDEVDFILDRPFVFVITGVSNDPLFVGVINNPLL